MKSIITKIINFIKKRGFIVMSGLFLVLFIIAVIFLVNLNSDIKELKAQSDSQQSAIFGFSSNENDLSEAIDDLVAQVDDLKSNEKENILERDSLLLELEEKQMLLDRKSIFIESEKVVYKDEDLFEKIVYLTFDDGPSGRTERILEKLDKYGVKATFFVNYNVYSDENNLYSEIANKGHALGNHTYDHILATNNWTEFYDNLFKMEDYLYEKAGVRPNIIRFPGGSKYTWRYSDENNKKAIELENMGYVFFDWNVSNYDSSNAIEFSDSDDMADYVIGQSIGRDKIILLMHDRSQKYMTVNSLDRIIQYYQKEGYVFLPLTENSVNMQFFSQDD